MDRQGRTEGSDEEVTENRVVVRRARNGRGLFAARAFRKGQTIIKLAGRIMHHDVLWDRGGRFADNCYRFGPETYLDPGEGPAAFVNHSCEPNTAVVKRNNQLFLVAAAPIAGNREIVIDYSTILGNDDIWTMKCNCGRNTCRGRIRRFGLLPAELRERYTAGGFVPKYILATKFV
jgi:SET domain-containing protein